MTKKCKRHSLRCREKLISHFFIGLLSMLICLGPQLSRAKTTEESGKMKFDLLQSSVTGTVTDENGIPLPGANVIVKGTTTGTQTDFDGNYTLDGVGSDAILTFSYIGYLSKEILVGQQTLINVTLSEDAQKLDEVVLLGYGKSVKKTDLTGAVSVVGIKDMEKTPLLNVDQALQGRASGVQITQSSGAPGAALKIRVRGSNSISGSNAPLVVVDGLIDVDINLVNPSDIQSVTVLKDASSTAIYGNRGANGVILIITKKGNPGKAIVEYGSFVSFSQAINSYDLLGPADFIEYANIKNIAATGNPIPVFNTQQKIDDFISKSVDYQDALFRTAVAQNYQLSFRGGSEKMDYFVSGNYLDQEGIARNTNFKRYALRSNINADITDKLTLSTNINLIRQEGFNNDVGLNNNLAASSITREPVNPIYDEDGNYVIETLVLGGLQQNLGSNPVWQALETKHENNVNRVQTNVQLNYNLFKNLDANFSGGIDYGNYSNAYFDPAAQAGAPITSGQNTRNDTKTQYALRLTYDNTFNERHNLNVSYIYEQRKNVEKGFNADGRGFFTSSVGFDNLGIADTQTIGSDVSERRLRSNVGRATYNYDSKYLVTASVRYDESSVFIKDQGGVFPSFALGWNINNESFFNSETITELRLRGGWGITGNELIGTSDALNLLRNNPWIPNGTTPVTAILPGTRLANPNLTWETTKQTNIGLDLGILNGRFNMSFEYYIKNTDNLLLTKNVPRYTGKVDQVVNAGEVENKGFEVNLFANITHNENFSWDVSGNLSSNKNKVVRLISGETRLFPSSEVFGNTTTPIIVQVGQPIGALFGYVYEGVDTANGNAIYAEERDIIGNSNADFTYGFNNNMSYKNFDFNFFFQGVQGNDVFNRARLKILGRSGDVPFGTSAEIANTWTPTNTTALIPSINASNTQLESSEFIEDASFLRLKNISIGYTLRDLNALKSIGSESLRLYVSAQNLLTITNYSGLDPEINSGGQDDRGGAIDLGVLPTSKTFTFGLNLKF